MEQRREKLSREGARQRSFRGTEAKRVKSKLVLEVDDDYSDQLTAKEQRASKSASARYPTIIGIVCVGVLFVVGSSLVLEHEEASTARASVGYNSPDASKSHYRRSDSHDEPVTGGNVRGHVNNERQREDELMRVMDDNTNKEEKKGHSRRSVTSSTEPEPITIEEETIEDDADNARARRSDQEANETKRLEGKSQKQREEELVKIIEENISKEEKKGHSRRSVTSSSEPEPITIEEETTEDDADNARARRSDQEAKESKRLEGKSQKQREEELVKIIEENISKEEKKGHSRRSVTSSTEPEPITIEEETIEDDADNARARRSDQEAKESKRLEGKSQKQREEELVKIIEENISKDKILAGTKS
eukprot:Nk52_evm19s225 gene=Nk52_evmTU19s225